MDLGAPPLMRFQPIFSDVSGKVGSTNFRLPAHILVSQYSAPRFEFIPSALKKLAVPEPLYPQAHGTGL